MANESNALLVYRIFQNMEKELNKVLAVVGKYLSKIKIYVRKEVRRCYQKSSKSCYFGLRTCLYLSWFS